MNDNQSIETSLRVTITTDFGHTQEIFATQPIFAINQMNLVKQPIKGIVMILLKY